MPMSTRLASIAQQLLPVVDWLPAYRRDWLVPDVLAGLAVWAVMVPEGMAYAGIVGVPPITGLYTIIPPLIVYALLGTSRLLVVGPDTATGDFFVCVGDQPELDFGGKRNPDGQGFAAFGRVVTGMDVVRKVQQAPADGQTLKPPVTITSAHRLP